MIDLDAVLEPVRDAELGAPSPIADLRTRTVRRRRARRARTLVAGSMAVALVAFGVARHDFGARSSSLQVGTASSAEPTTTPPTSGASAAPTTLAVRAVRLHVELRDTSNPGVPEGVELVAGTDDAAFQRYAAIEDARKRLDAYGATNVAVTADPASSGFDINAQLAGDDTTLDTLLSATMTPMVATIIADSPSGTTCPQTRPASGAATPVADQPWPSRHVIRCVTTASGVSPVRDMAIRLVPDGPNLYAEVTGRAFPPSGGCMPDPQTMSCKTSVGLLEGGVVRSVQDATFKFGGGSGGDGTEEFTGRFAVEPGAKTLWDAVTAVPRSSRLRLVIRNDSGAPVGPQVSGTPSVVVLPAGSWVDGAQPTEGSWSKVTVIVAPIAKGTRLGDAVTAGTLTWVWVPADQAKTLPAITAWNGAEELHARVDIAPGTVLQQDLFA